MADGKAIKAPLLGKSGSVTLDAAIFGEPFSRTVVHEVVRAERNARRRGTASTRSRGEIAMTGAKAWRQKGTGRARVGAQSVPHRRSGGVAFGPKPRSYRLKVNRKLRRKALRATLSLHAERGSLAIVEADGFAEPSTREAATALGKWQETGSVVVVTGSDTERACALSFRNIDRVRAVLPVDAAGVYDLMAARNVVLSKAALDRLAEIAAPGVGRGTASAGAEGDSQEDGS